MKITKKTHRPENAMVRFKTLEDAEGFMRIRNHAESQNPRPELVVLVDGPEDDFVVMSLREAIEEEFPYKWSV